MDPSVEPTTPEPTTTEERLHRVATELFAERGYGGTSMSDIARGVGVRKASLYNYYGSKDELLMDLVRRALETWTACSRPPLEAGGSRQRRLRAHLEAAVRFVDRHPHEAAILRLAATQIAGELGERVQSLLGEHERDYRPFMERFFAGAMEEREIEPADPGDLLVYWQVFFDGFLINELLCPCDSNRYRGRLEQLWNRFWRGLAGAAEPAADAAEEEAAKLEAAKGAGA
jgi:AcrR family transcriptional regulator